MIAKVYSAIPDGYEGHIIEVEGSSAKSLPTFNIVGMAAKTVSEARERVRSAIANSDFSFPNKKITVNLAPAELTKSGTHLDLPIALAILVLAGQILPEDLQNKLFVGELSLDGRSKPVRGVINIAETAQKASFKELYIPQDNLNQALLIPGIKIRTFNSLQELVLHLKGIKKLPTPPHKPVVVKNTTTDTTILDDVRGQQIAKRALLIAIAGHHNILLSGPPGSGKTLLANVAHNLLPEMSTSEKISVTKIHSLFSATNEIVSTRPFRAPHHTASNIALIGGGVNALPGEISLAHNGILFLDELPEFPRNAIESLRQPLENRQITISRASNHIQYPANFILIATMNPCPCGHLHDPNRECSCTTKQIEQYRKRISGPILDRIDLILNLSPVKQSDLVPKLSNVKNTETDLVNQSVSTKAISERVKITQTDTNKYSEQERAQKLIGQARLIQAQRYHNSDKYNGDLSSRLISDYVKITQTGQNMLNAAFSSLKLSARAYYKVIKVAQTIADLAGKTEVDIEQISEALSFRQDLQ